MDGWIKNGRLGQLVGWLIGRRTEIHIDDGLVWMNGHTQMEALAAWRSWMVNTATKRKRGKEKQHKRAKRQEKKAQHTHTHKHTAVDSTRQVELVSRNESSNLIFSRIAIFDALLPHVHLDLFVRSFVRASGPQRVHNEWIKVNFEKRKCKIVFVYSYVVVKSDCIEWIEWHKRWWRKQNDRGWRRDEVRKREEITSNCFWRRSSILDESSDTWNGS